MTSNTVGWSAKIANFLLLLSVAAPLFGGVPTVVSITPSSGGGTSQTFTLTTSDTVGVGALGIINLLINNQLDGSNACYLAIVPAGSSAASVYLINNAGPDFGAQYLAIPGSASVANSQCQIFAAGSSVSSSGNVLTITLQISFTSSFGGSKIMYAAAREVNSGPSSGWQSMGVWQPPPLPNTLPRVVGMVPGRGSGAGSIEFRFGHASGWSSINVANILVNNALDAANACYMAFVPTNASAGTIYLVNDAGDAGGALQALAIPGSGVISNSQCTISAAGSSVSGSGTALSVSLNMSFSAGFAGNRIVYAANRDYVGNNTGWLPTGTWNVPGNGSGSGAFVTVTGVTPSIAVGLASAQEVLTVSFASTTGSSTIAGGQILLSTDSNGPNGTVACQIEWTASGVMNAVTPSTIASGLAGAYPSPATVPLCSVNIRRSRISNTPTGIDVMVALTLDSSFVGNPGARVYAYGINTQGLSGPWTNISGFSQHNYTASEGTTLSSTVPYVPFAKSVDIVNDGNPQNTRNAASCSGSANCNNATCTTTYAGVTATPTEKTLTSHGLVLTAIQTTLSGNGIARCTVGALSIDFPFRVSDASPSITAIQQSPPIYAGGPFSITIVGRNFGPSTGSLIVCAPAQVGCSATLDFSASPTYWSIGRIDVQITPASTGVSGLYGIVVSSMGASGTGFVPLPTRGPAARYSNKGGVLFSPAPPTPTARISRRKGDDSSVVSGNSPGSAGSTISIGELLSLEGDVQNVPLGVTVTSRSWTVPGAKVRNYVQTVGSSTIEQLPNVLSDSSLNFYWIDGGTSSSPMVREIVFTATLSAGAPVQASVFFTVVRPENVLFTGTICPCPSPLTPVNIGTLFAENNPARFHLKLGYDDGPNIGIQFKIGMYAGFKGEFALVQLVRNETVLEAPGASPTLSNTAGGFVLDNNKGVPGAVQYSGIVTNIQNAQIDPTDFLTDFPSDFLDTQWSSLRRKDDFQTFFMYKPLGVGSIWVALARLDWGWSGNATGSGNNQWMLSDFGPNIQRVVSPVSTVGSSVPLPQWQTSLVPGQ